MMTTPARVEGALIRRFPRAGTFLWWRLAGAAFLAAGLAPVLTGVCRAAPPPAGELYSLTEGGEVKVPARTVSLPFTVVGSGLDRAATFSPSGIMGDTNAISVLAEYGDGAPVPGADNAALKIRYEAKGRERWAGVYWLTPANNWGKIKGAGFDLRGADRLSFWMKGERGGERIVSVGVGGVTGAYPDSDGVTMGPIRLEKEWTRYTIDLGEKDLRHIIGGFMFSVRRADNPRGAVFYLDEIVFESDAVEAALAEAAEEAASKPAPPPRPADEVLTEELRRTVLFETGAQGFSADTRREMVEMVRLAQRYRGSPIRVEGHTDNVGSFDLNVTLSEERARTVADFLVGFGVDPGRITVKGWGPARPVTPESNRTDVGRRLNRRVEIILEVPPEEGP